MPADVVRANGMISATNLIVRERFGPGPTIALNAHGDVVPPGLGWTTDPYGADDQGRIHVRPRRRGVEVRFRDLQLRAARAEGERRAARAAPSSCTSPTTRKSAATSARRWLLAQGMSRPDFAISAGFAYGITTAHNGCLHLEVEIVGRSAHAARPDTGIDALEAATGVLARPLRDPQDVRGDEIEDRRHRHARRSPWA